MQDKTMLWFLQISIHRMVSHHLPKIHRCLDAVTTAELWDHDANQTNSVGGILLHICEQVQRHTLAYPKGGAVSASGVENYFPDTGVSPGELAHKVEETFTAWHRAIQAFIHEDSNDIDIHSIYHLVEHTSYHVGQVIDRIQQRTGQAFQFVQSGLNERNLRAVVEREAASQCRKFV